VHAISVCAQPLPQSLLVIFSYCLKLSLLHNGTMPQATSATPSCPRPTTVYVFGTLWPLVMADSKCLSFECLCDICNCDNRLQSFLHLHKVLFNFRRQCYRCGIGSINLRQDRSIADGQIWRCSNRKCSVKIPIRRHSFFSGSHFSFSQVIKLIYYWTYQYPQHIVLHETGLSNKTVIDFYNFYRKVCVVILEDHSEPIGGPGRVVEVDESKFGKRKFSRGKKVDGVWVFGGIERDNDPPHCFFETVTDRSAEKLVPIIKWWILPGTTIYSHCWHSYSTLVSEGYIHSTVNHSVDFKSETGTRTNSIESRWHVAKKSLPHFGTRKDLYNSYFARYCIRRKFVNGASDNISPGLGAHRPRLQAAGARAIVCASSAARSAAARLTTFGAFGSAHSMRHC